MKTRGTNTVNMLFRRSLLSLLALAALALGIPAAAAEQIPGFANLDFENGRSPWAVWYSDDRNYQGPRFEYGPDTSIYRFGKASLRIVATSRDGRAFVHQTTDKFRAGARYELSYWIKFSAAEMAPDCDVRVNILKRGGAGQDRKTRAENPVLFAQPGENGWIFRRGCFTVDADAVALQLGLYVHDTVGTVWFDDIRFRVMEGDRVSVDSMYLYYPVQVKLDGDMLQRFNRLAAQKSPLLDRAKRYNRLLVEVARAGEDARRLQRSAGYLSGMGKSAEIAAEMTHAQDAEDRLDELYQTYGRLFVVGQSDGLESFDRAAGSLDALVTNSRRQIAERLQALQDSARELAGRWPKLPQPQAKPVVIAPDGKPNQIVIGTRSPYSHFELEEPLTINRLHSVTALYSRSEGLGKYDFRPDGDAWLTLARLGASQATIDTPFALHDKQYAPEWFLKQYQDDPDIFMQSADAAQLAPPQFGAALNIWRPEVRAMTLDAVTQFGRAFASQPQFVCYVTAAENLGPYFSVADGVRSTGYNRSALADFQAWLQQRYGTIAELNRQWKSGYGSFADVRPPADLTIVNQWPRPHPLGSEFQLWREERHLDWQKLIYQALKKADPAKPVMADHSRLLASLDGSRISETADILSFHARSPLFMLGSIYCYSLNRFAHKQLGQYECFWGCQEDLPRIAEEKVQRAAMMKYLYRLTVWGRNVQIWWYAYTAADYLLSYNGNWFNPVYDLTTLRYSAAALPVGREKVKRLEPLLLDSAIVPARIVVIQPNTSMRVQRYALGPSFLEMLELHEFLFGRNDLYELIPEGYFVDGRASLDDFDVVILPYAPYFPDRFAGPLRDWIRKGGTLIATGPFGLYDKFGFDRAELWTELFGLRAPLQMTGPTQSEWKWSVAPAGTGPERWTAHQPFPQIGVVPAGAGPDMLDAHLGFGRVLVTLCSLRNGEFRQRATSRIAEALEGKLRRGIRSTASDLELTLHRRADGQRFVCVINRNVDRAIYGTLTVPSVLSRVVDEDVPGGFPVPLRISGGESSFSVRLEPAEFTVLTVEP